MRLFESNQVTIVQLNNPEEGENGKNTKPLDHRRPIT